MGKFSFTKKRKTRDDDLFTEDLSLDTEEVEISEKSVKKTFFNKKKVKPESDIEEPDISIEKFGTIKDADQYSEETQKKIAKAQQDFKKSYEFKVTTNSIMTEVVFIAALLISCFIIFSFFKINTVDGKGMSPFLNDHSVVFVNTLHYKKHPIERGDLITCNDTVTRVIGLSGDEVSFYSGRIYINDIPIKETYIDASTKTWCFKESSFTVPENKVFVLFDNRAFTVNPEEFLIDTSLINGKVVERL